jgi:hypothetical protein
MNDPAIIFAEADTMIDERGASSLVHSSHFEDRRNEVRKARMKNRYSRVKGHSGTRSFLLSNVRIGAGKGLSLRQKRA